MSATVSEAVITLPSGVPDMRILNRLWEDEEGQDLTEYALLMVLIALVAIVSMQTLGQTISNVFSNASQNLTTAS